MNDNDYGRKFCQHCDNYHQYVCAEHRYPTYEQLRKKIAILEAQIQQQRTTEIRNYRDQYDYLPYENEDR
jgi:uncharacterized FlgJ-related protein